jgi:pimeloyl-ACP methyl ester carboxylesterase
MQHLLLLHGAIGSADQLKPIATAVAHKYIVHTLNFSGHGGEQDIPDFRIESFADDVLHYLRMHKIESVHVFGYSMGGYVALYLAKHHPEKINKVFTLATKFLWNPAIAQQEINMLDANKVAEKIPAFAQILEKRHSPNDWKMVLKKTADMMIVLGNDNPLKKEDYEHIQQPVLIGIGDKDTMVTLEETIEVYRKLKQANLIVFPKTPHPIEKVTVDRLAKEMELFFQ